jgi:4-amino-4-deoxy-L-arabinose transferase-like glycosyltransferase
MYADEPWVASTAWKIVTDGRFGSNMFTGLHGMSEHIYTHLPLYPLILAGFFAVFGLGWWIGRFTTVLLGFFILCLTYSLGRRLFNDKVGLWAVICLLFVRTAGVIFVQLTGILLLDLARITRYDMLVPVFGLLALHLYHTAASRPDWWVYTLAGMMAGCAALSHIYGGFWFVALIILSVWQRRGWRSYLGLGVGFSFIWLPYLLYVWQGRVEWQLQLSLISDRFEIGRFSWYLSNLLQEYKRYGPGLYESTWGLMARPGFWFMVLLLPCAVIGLGKISFYQKDKAAQTLLVPLLTIPFLLALLISPKVAKYLTAALPLFSLGMGWVVVSAWQKTQHYARGGWLRAVMCLVCLAVLIEGSSRIYLLTAAAKTTTPYALLIAEVRQQLPVDGRILGFHNYWFGLDDLAYTTWLVPLWLAMNGSLLPELEAINPTAIIWDDQIEKIMEQNLEQAKAVAGWLDEQGFVTAVTLYDPTYGTIHILKRSPEQAILR